MTRTTLRFAAIDHVQVAAPAGCEAAAREFYGTTLGMYEIPKPASLQSRGGCWFQCGDQQLHVGVEEDFRPNKKAHPAFVVSGWNMLVEILVGRRPTVIDDNKVAGVRRFYTDDPWGNRLEFIDADRSPSGELPNRIGDSGASRPRPTNSPMPTTAGYQRILTISGSLRTQSSNAALLRSAIALSPDNTSFDIYSGLAFLPHFNPDLDQAPVPQAVADFRCQLRESHAVLISSPEYSHGIPGVLKNALDWIVSSGELYGKPIALFNASPRATFAQAALKETLTVMGARLISQACISVPMAAGELDGRSVLSDSVIASGIRDALLELVNAASLNSAEDSNTTWNKSSEKE